MTLEQKFADMERRIDNAEALLQLQSLTISTLLSANSDIPLLLQCMRGIAEQQDAHGLYATSLSDGQLHRVLSAFQAQIAEIERRLVPPA